MPGANSDGHVLAVEREDLRRRAALAVLRHEAAAAVVAVVDRQIDRQDLHLERVARLGAFDVHRAGEDVTAGPAAIAGHLGDDRLQRRLDLVVGHAGAREAGRVVGQQRVDVDDVARRDAQRRLRLGPVVADGDRRRRRLEAMRLRRPGPPARRRARPDPAHDRTRQRISSWFLRHEPLPPLGHARGRQPGGRIVRHLVLAERLKRLRLEVAEESGLLARSASTPIRRRRAARAHPRTAPAPRRASVRRRERRSALRRAPTARRRAG